ncbi:hypothetical protein Anapl_11628, partial [Anas platyrhynchos]
LWEGRCLVLAGFGKTAPVMNAGARFCGHWVSCTFRNTSVEVTPSYSQLQRQPNKPVGTGWQAVGVTTRTFSEGSSGNASVTEPDRAVHRGQKLLPS